MTKESEKQIEAIRKMTDKAVAAGPEACRQLLIDAGIIKDEDKHYGFYQLCPKCDGEGKLIGEFWDGVVYSSERTCPVCNGAKLLVRPEIKKEDSL